MAGVGGIGGSFPAGGFVAPARAPRAQGEDGATGTTARTAGPTPAGRTANGKGPDGLTEGEREQVKELRARDREVRTHEQAHKAVGGAFAGAPTYEYAVGPDGQRYAVGGEVKIDVAPESDPEATIVKMEVVKRAALAPAEPSPQDRAVAALADQQKREAQARLTEQRSLEQEARLLEARAKSEERSQDSGADGGERRDAAAARAAARAYGRASEAAQSIPVLVLGVA